MPCRALSSSLEGLLAEKFSAHKVQGHHLTFVSEYNMHTKYSDSLVYEEFGIQNILDLQ